MANPIAKERLYLTEDKKKVVGEGDSRAAFLWAAPGDELPEEDAKRFGVPDGKLKGGKKEAPAPANKELKPGKNKSGSSGQGGPKSGDGKSGADGAKDLTAIKGIGEATAKALTEAGIADPAALAAVDPASPPEVKGLPPGFNWNDITAAAKALAGDAEGASE
jgi:predicted flap endonuclease-1-like 5' DNA nuclease